MRIGMFGGDTANRTIDDVIAAARETEAAGFASFWLPQIFGMDAISLLAVVGREVPRIELGTAVVPTYPRHPMMLAQQTLTTQAATGGRFILGIGLSHQIVIEGMFGLSFDKPARHMREYLSILVPLVHGEDAQFAGETLSAHGSVNVADAPPCPILIAALAPRMLQLAGAVADGTITWMTGPATLAEHTIPSITKAARDAGRPAPRVCASLPVCVTDDTDAARARAAQEFSVYGMLPSYRAMLDREGAAGPADVAIVGDAATVRDAVNQLGDIGVTDFAPALFGSPDEARATRDLLASLL
ncbi:MAG TPA: TIGR03564 family F420-dependent LLM class oxidoreductase [Acidimicrobiia bacterium]|jgi:F420-dependent oxidoreductase-like protein|nr:TIGR03564 family F420-dependent LLM class oxidoreductase [Acidimicrobiia bacterium]